MRPFRPDEIFMNFVCHHNHIMFMADTGNRFQFFPGPDPSCRIVGTAHQEQFHLIRYDFLFKIRKVNFIVPVLQDQIAAHPAAAVIQNHFAERIIHRLLDQHGIAWIRERFDRHGQRKHHARRLQKPILLYLPVMLFPEPLLQYMIEPHRIRFAVTKNTVGRPFLYRLYDRLCNGKIHIRHPERQNILRIPAPNRSIEFQAIGIAAIDDVIQIH